MTTKKPIKEYKPIFETIEETTFQNIDLNWFALSVKFKTLFRFIYNRGNTNG